MGRYLPAVRIAAVLGAVVGAAVGLREWSSAWPLLSLRAASGPAAIGWLIGIALSPAVAWRLARRRPAEARPTSRWRLLARGTLILLSIAPPALWLAIGPRSAPARVASQGRPNLILITVDALRADHLGAYGSTLALTPNLDAFASEATIYEAAYSSSPWTLTSFGSLFTSLAPSQIGLKLTTSSMHDWYLYSAKLPAEVRLFPEDLQPRGYTTAAELTNCFLTEERGWGRGFDSFRNEDGPALGAILTRADTVTTNGLAWLRLSGSRPFFLWLHYLDPHVPYNSPETPRELREQYPSDWLTRREYWYGTMIRRDEATKARYEEFCRRMYAEEVRYADKWVGRLLDGLKRGGLWDQSLIVITSDHGEELFDHGGFEHGHTMHEELLHVPLLVKWPAGMKADARVSQVVGLTDLAPTFLSAAGAEPPKEMSGRALPRADGASSEEIYSEGILHGLEQMALATDGYRAIWRPETRLHQEALAVYARGVDPTEQKPLAQDEAPAGVVRRLRDRGAQAAADSAKWKASGKQEFRGIDLSHATREKLRTLGYLGD